MDTISVAIKVTRHVFSVGYSFGHGCTVTMMVKDAVTGKAGVMVEPQLWSQ